MGLDGGWKWLGTVSVSAFGKGNATGDSFDLDLSQTIPITDSAALCALSVQLLHEYDICFGRV